MTGIQSHFIVCGFGSAGKVICLRLFEKGIPFAVVDKDDNEISHAEIMKYNAVLGDATEDVTLSMAGIENATGLIACLATDSDNLFVSLAAKELNPKINITVCGRDESIEKRLLKSGASQVFYPSRIGVEKIANQILGRETTADRKVDSASIEVKGYLLKVFPCKEEKTVSAFMKTDDSILKVLKIESGSLKSVNPVPDAVIPANSRILSLCRKM